ncbi:MAG TPA: tetraacyldisaccharide 4'-kinase [Gemmatimonadaceae bacterium]
MRGVESIWSHDSAASFAARALLSPFAVLYRAGAGMRNWMYDRELLASEESPVPVISIGNISVGGTGKTPFSAWIAKQLIDRGASPAVVLRGYGDDEPQVHRLLNPNVRIVVSPSRVDGIKRAAEQGADSVVLDDAFQHRHAKRSEDIVLVSADTWTPHQRSLPAGPWREPLSSLARASLIVITRKAVDSAKVHAVSDAIRRVAPGVPQASVHFGLDRAHRVSAVSDASKGGREPIRDLRSLAGKRALAIAAIADTTAFFAQLEQSGLTIERVSFTDHHQFTTADVARLLRHANHVDAVVCTLKDAVKLGALWPAASTPLWYVSQSIAPENGESEIEAVLARILTRIGQQENRETTRPHRPLDQTPT